MFPSLPSRRIFGLRFKITSSTMPDDRSTYIGLHQSTKLLYLASAYLGQIPNVCESTADFLTLTPPLDTTAPPMSFSVHSIAINSTLQEQKKKRKKMYV